MREALDALIQLAAYRHSTPGDQKSALDEIFILPDERRSRWRRTGIRTLGPSSSKAGPRPRHDSAAAPSGGRPSCGRGCGGGGRRLKFVVRVTCEQPASFQNRVSLAQSASVPEPIETQTSIPTSAGSRPACSVRVRSWPNTSGALAAG